VIKRYILHFEFHKGYWPIISFRRVPKHGDRVEDGGVMGTLIACKACSGVGLLHVADEIKLPEGVVPSIMPEPKLGKYMDKNKLYILYDRDLRTVSMLPRLGDPLTEVLIGSDSLEYEVDEIVSFNGRDHRVEVFEPGKRVLLREVAISLYPKSTPDWDAEEQAAYEYEKKISEGYFE
jgi:hypothetical protein